MKLEFSLAVGLLGFALFSIGCNEQHDPSGHWQRIEAESTTANRAPVKLTDQGTIPGATDTKIDISQKYSMFCASCHGATGAGDGAGGAALAVKPRDLTDKKWQSSVDDKQIELVIAKGGPAAGLDAAMAPWGALLSPEELQLMVQHVRSFGK